MRPSGRSAASPYFWMRLGGRRCGARVQRLELGPGAVELGGELVGRHVVAGTPKIAGVLVARLARADVLKLNEAGVRGAHGSADGVPADPEALHLFGVARFREDAAHLVDAEALCAFGHGLAGGGAGAVLAFAVHAGELGGDGGAFGEEFGVVRGGGGVDLEEHELPTLGGREGEVIEAMTLFDELELEGRALLDEKSAGGFGVLVDVGLGEPLGVRAIDGCFAELGAGAVEKGLGIRCGGWRGSLGVERERRKAEQEKHGETHGWECTANAWEKTRGMGRAAVCGSGEGEAGLRGKLEAGVGS